MFFKKILFYNNNINVDFNLFKDLYYNSYSNSRSKMNTYSDLVQSQIKYLKSKNPPKCDFQIKLSTPSNSEIICGQNVSTKVVCGIIFFYEKKAMLKI